MKFYFIYIILILYSNCKGQTPSKMTHKYTNALINETSPYLLQHAHNPVNWMAWSKTPLELAKKENKLILISVGYAACHWCHVMEHESFEDDEVAKIMNTHFINIKVDREERPDVDQVYMSAVQLMTRQGGWPLNVIALPDGRPIWGGTYFPKDKWTGVLQQLAKLYKDNPEKLIEYAEKLEQGITTMNLVETNPNASNFSNNTLIEAINTWKKNFDYKMGGNNWAPKFMMPNNYHFLLRYAYQNNDKELMDYVNLTLTKMANGGVFDHVGGGFSRYSVDKKWHVPHFEKMLYDNGQLVSLYADAYLLTKNELYKNIVYKTLDYVTEEMTTNEGAFYSSLDADSLNEHNKLEEGAFYVWKKEKLKELLENDYNLFADYYNINNYGLWEHGNYVLIKTELDEVFIKKKGISATMLKEKKNQWHNSLKKEQSKRPRPRLDDKTLTSWNALMLKGYTDAYRVFNDTHFLECAIKNANFILNKQLQENGALLHNYKNGKSTINGYLEDYALTIKAFITLYENTLDQKWLTTARQLTDYTFEHFFNTKNSLFYFTSKKDDALVTRPLEYHDNVIPASNSVMAKNLFKLGHYFANNAYLKTAKTMLNNVQPEFINNPSSFSNWLDVMLNFTQPFYEIAIVGKNAHTTLKQLNTHYIPNKLVVGSKTESELPLLKNRYIENETLIYVCVNSTCKLPVKTLKDALKQIKY